MGQELNSGLAAGAAFTNNKPNAFTWTYLIEYRPHKSMLSINSGITLIAGHFIPAYSFPLYLKVIIGNQFRVCPSFGGFIRTNKSHGLSSGVTLEYEIPENLVIYLQGDYNRDYQKVEIPTHMGQTGESTSTFSSIWISIGLKKNILQ